MKTVVAIVMGFFSGLLIYFMVSMVLSDPSTSEPPSTALVAIIFFGGWALSAWAIRRGTDKLSKVFARGFLVGAAEWLAMIGVGVISGGKAAAATQATAGGSDAALAGAAVGGGMIAMFTGGISFVMALICLAGFAVAYFMGREMPKEMPSGAALKRN